MTHDELVLALNYAYPPDPDGLGTWSLRGDDLGGLDWSQRHDAPPTLAELESALGPATSASAPATSAAERVLDALDGLDPATVSVADVIDAIRSALRP